MRHFMTAEEIQTMTEGLLKAVMKDALDVELGKRRSAGSHGMKQWIALVLISPQTCVLGWN